MKQGTKHTIPDRHAKSASGISKNYRVIGILLLCAGLISAIGKSEAYAQDLPRVFHHIETIDLPANPGAHEPSLVQHGNRLYLSWMEHSDDLTSVMMAIREDQRWSEPRVVHQASDLFVNWADYPSIAIFRNGNIAVHWLKKTDSSGFDYWVEIALSEDDGMTWSIPIIPHHDRSLAQHGFVSMIPTGQDGMTIIWLDGRAYESNIETVADFPNAMQLRATLLAAHGILGPDEAVDLQTCSCCQTSLTSTRSGTILAAYRDRTDGEIRDISVARLKSGKWYPSISVHRDGWELAGCPVNGPAIDAEDKNIAVAWFTGAQDRAAVKVAFSDDEGMTFEDTVRIDLGEPLGRVDVEMLEDGTAIVSWIEWNNGDEALMLCRVQRNAGCIAREKLATNTASASINFPKLARVGHDIYVVWTQPDEAGDALAMRRATLAREH